MATKVCNHCGFEKDETEFSWRFKALGIRNPACKRCQYDHNKRYYSGDAGDRHREQVRERTEAAREVAREYVYQYLLTHPCVGADQTGCPYNETDPQVLEF